MGAWGHNIFENDDALDFLGEVEELGKDKLTEKILSVAELDEADYLEATDASECLAAIEYFAAAKGRPSGDFPAEADTWLKQNSPLPVIETEIMKSTLVRIRNKSELQELWEEADELTDWLKTIDDLEKRLG
ncbi:MAG: DUF4259 domain-containing protein [Ferruginibacter sp.]